MELEVAMPMVATKQDGGVYCLPVELCMRNLDRILLS
jgi:hypothetical protein